MAMEAPKLLILPLLLEVVAHEAKAPVAVVLLGVQTAIVHDVLEGVVHQPSSTPGILALYPIKTYQEVSIQFAHAGCITDP